MNEQVRDVPSDPSQFGREIGELAATAALDRLAERTKVGVDHVSGDQLYHLRVTPVFVRAFEPLELANQVRDVIASALAKRWPEVRFVIDVRHHDGWSQTAVFPSCKPQKKEEEEIGPAWKDLANRIFEAENPRWSSFRCEVKSAIFVGARLTMRLCDVSPQITSIATLRDVSRRLHSNAPLLKSFEYHVPGCAPFVYGPTGERDVVEEARLRDGAAAEDRLRGGDLGPDPATIVAQNRISIQRWRRPSVQSPGWNAMMDALEKVVCERDVERGWVLDDTFMNLLSHLEWALRTKLGIEDEESIDSDFEDDADDEGEDVSDEEIRAERLEARKLVDAAVKNPPAEVRAGAWRATALALEERIHNYETETTYGLVDQNLLDALRDAIVVYERERCR